MVSYYGELLIPTGKNQAFLVFKDRGENNYSALKDLKKLNMSSPITLPVNAVYRRSNKKPGLSELIEKVVDIFESI